MKTSDEGKSPSDKGSFSGPKACGAPGNSRSKSKPHSGLQVLCQRSRKAFQPADFSKVQTTRQITTTTFTSRRPSGLQRAMSSTFTSQILLERPDQVDYVELTDGDGTLLGHFASRDHIKNNITSNTETVFVLFHTDGSVTERGWSLEWSEYS